MASFAPAINHGIPCVHTNHLFDAPLCKDLPLYKRIGNVVFHILFLVGIPLGLYKLYTFYAAKKAAEKNTHEKALQVLVIDPTTSVGSQEEEKKKAIITQLPQWFVNHFSETSQEYVKNIYTREGWFIDISLDPDKSIDDALGSLKERIVDGLASPWNKTHLALSALMLPKDNPILCDVVKDILHSAWAKVLLTCDQPSISARSNEYINGCITVDSRTILIEELHKHAAEMPEDYRKNWIDGVKAAEVYNRLDVRSSAPFFTIHVSAPK